MEEKVAQQNHAASKSTWAGESFRSPDPMDRLQAIPVKQKPAIEWSKHGDVL